MKKSTILKLILALILIIFAISCGSKNGKEETTEKKHLNVALHWLPDDLDPANAWNGWVLTRTGVGETLITINEKMEIVPQLADSWENIDEKTWKFHIRKGVKFHNGTELTPELVKASIDRVVQLNERGKPTLKLEKVEVDGEYVVFTTEIPYGAFLPSISEPMYVILDTTADTSKFGEMPIGTGPYKVVDYKEKVSFDTEAHKEYWGVKPGVDSMKIYVIADNNTRALALQSGDVDIIQHVRDGNIKLFEKNPDYIVELEAGTRVDRVIMNVKGILSNKNLRLAINSAVDYETAAKAIGVNSLAAGSPFPSNTPYSQKITKASFNLDKSKKYLEAAGYEDTNNDGIVDKNGKNLELNLYLTAKGNTALAELLQGQLSKAGIKININLVENLKEYETSGNFDLVLTNWQTVSTGDSQWFLDQAFKSGAGTNYGKYNNKELDEIIDQLSVTFDTNKRIELTQKASQIVVDEGLGTYILSQSHVNAANKKVKNMITFPIDYYFITPNITIEK